MRKRKSYTEPEVVKAIDAAYRKIERLRAKAVKAHEEAAFYRDIENSQEFKKSNDLAEKLLSQVGRIQNTRLKKLGMMLSELRTRSLGESAGVPELVSNTTKLPAIT